MKSDSTIRSRNVVVGLSEHGIKVIQGQVLGQQFVGQSVAFNQGFQLLSVSIFNKLIFKKKHRVTTK